MRKVAVRLSDYHKYSVNFNYYIIWNATKNHISNIIIINFVSKIINILYYIFVLYHNVKVEGNTYKFMNNTSNL